MDRVKKADELHSKGYNCAQAVACAYCDLFNADEKEVFRMMVSGMVTRAGLKNSDANLDTPKTKGSTYKIAKELTAAFRDKVGSVICADIKGVESGEPLKSCKACIEDAARIVEEKLL